MAIKNYILEEKDYIISLRRHFHAHPEVSLKEYETCKKIEEELDALRIPHRRIGETGVYAWIDGKKACKGKIVALRADMDALAMEDLKTVSYRSQNKGFCHACGHDAHTATLLAAAKVLKSKETGFSGQVRLFFQQAEEIGQGARLFVGAGLLEGCERIYGAHVTSRLAKGQVALTKGPQCASCDYFKITVKGKGAHVSTPHLGVDAAYITAQIAVNLQSIVARSTAQQLVDPVDIVSDYQKSLGADDFADYLAVTKGMYAYIGTANEEKANTKAAHHHGLFDIDEEALLLSCNLYVDYALHVLGQA